MKNSVICPNCNTANPFYNSNCSKCRNYLRDKIHNLDLWSIISLLVESPSKAFNKIVFAEHKNFIFFLFLIVTTKHLINSRFISMLSLGNFNTRVELFYSYLVVSGVLLLFYLTFSFLYVKIGISINISLRFKDTFALIIYSQLPFVFGLLLLFALELIIFGDYLFSINPSPFIIKPALAYLFSGLEVLIIFWSVTLLFIAFKTQTHHKIFSIISSILFFVFFWLLIYLCSLMIFTI